MKYLWVMCAAFVAAGCGVRGRPLPPEVPAPLGRGEPSFSKATEKVTLPPTKKKDANPWSDPGENQEGN